MVRAISAPNSWIPPVDTDMKPSENTLYSPPKRRQFLSGVRMLTLAGVLGLTSAAWAQGDNDSLQLSGFGTLGLAYHNHNGVQYRRDISQRDGASAGIVSLDVDSMLGVQAAWNPDPHWQAMLQVVSRQSVDAGYRPQATWGYAKYTPNESFSTRVGRLGIEMYFQGDAAEIGYANLPIRQPVIFYPRTMEGVDAEILQPLGTGTLRLKGMLGAVMGKLPSAETTYDTRGSKLHGALVEYTRGSWTGRVSMGSLTLKNELPNSESLQSLYSALTMVPNGEEIRAAISMQNRILRYTSLAVAYDSGSLQGLASYSTIDSAAWARTNLFYVIASYRVGAFTPYLVYSQTHTGRDVVSTGIPVGASSQTDRIAQAAALAQGSAKINQTNFALGLRYDISRNAAIKLQMDAIRYQDSGNIRDDSLSATPYANRGYKDLRVFSAALEFVF